MVVVRIEDVLRLEFLGMVLRSEILRLLFSVVRWVLSVW